MSKVETPAEKTARLRALRYTRDGHPDENRARAKAAAVYAERVRNARADAAMNALTDEMERLGVATFAERYLGIPK